MANKDGAQQSALEKWLRGERSGEILRRKGLLHSPFPVRCRDRRVRLDAAEQE